MIKNAGRGHHENWISPISLVGYSMITWSAVRVTTPAIMPSAGVALQPTMMPMPALRSRIHTQRIGRRGGVAGDGIFLDLIPLTRPPFSRGIARLVTRCCHNRPPFVVGGARRCRASARLESLPGSG